MKYSVHILLVFLFAYSPYYAASAACKPLLLLIEGGAWSSRDGESMEELANSIVDRYNELGISVINVDNAPFWTGNYNWIPEGADQLAQKVVAAGHWPLVIVGHSLGGATAHRLANRVATSLLVTLDAVSFNDDRPAPSGAAMWVNVWVDRNAWGPDWGYEPHADIDYSIGDRSHSDVLAMYTSTEERVLDALTSCPQGTRVEAAPKELCDTDSIGCSVRWRLTDGCSDGKGIDVRFFEFDLGWNKVASWRQRTIPSNGASSFNLECDDPANFVCFGGQRSDRRSWGVGMDGDARCQNCCYACRYGQGVDFKATPRNILTCF